MSSLKIAAVDQGVLPANTVRPLKRARRVRRAPRLFPALRPSCVRTSVRNAKGRKLKAQTKGLLAWAALASLVDYDGHCIDLRGSPPSWLDPQPLHSPPPSEVAPASSTAGPPRPRNINVTITLDGVTFETVAPASMTVAEFASSHVDLPAGACSLTFQGGLIAERETLSSAGIRNGASVTLHLAMRGGADADEFPDSPSDKAAAEPPPKQGV